MAVPLLNSFEGGTDGTTISTGNSGGASGNAFNDITIGTGYTLTYENSPVLSGAMCAAVTPGATSSATEFRWDTAAVGTIGPTIYTRMYVRFSALASGVPNNRPFNLTLSGSQRCALVFWGSALPGKFTWSNASDSGGTTSTMTMSANTLYRFECEWTLSATVGRAIIRCYLGNSNTPLETLDSGASQNFGGTTMNSIGFGYRTAGTSTDYGIMYLDGLAIGTTGYFGPLSESDLFLDDFNRTAGDPGASWSNPIISGFNEYDIVANELSGVAFSDAYWNTSFAADQEAFVTVKALPAAGNVMRLLCRIQNPNTGSYQFYEVLVDDTGALYLQKNIAATVTLLQNLSSTAAVGDVVGISANGTTIRGFKNGVQVGTDVTDSSITGAGYIGLNQGNTTTPIWDDFGGGEIESEETALGYQRLYGPAQLATSAADLYTVPTGQRTRVRHIYANNPSGSPVDFTLSVGTDAAATRLYDSYNIPAGGSLEWAYDHALTAGEKIQAYAGTATTLVLEIDGYVEEV